MRDVLVDLDTLNLLTTEAILRAEALTDLGSPGARAAHLEVSQLEERIADLTLASSAEGAFARRGAIGAAVLAGRMDRAEELVATYGADPGAPEGLREELKELVARLAEDEQSQRREAIAKGFPSATARYSAGELVRLTEIIGRQAEPLPIAS